jgi:hypothetical protein
MGTFIVLLVVLVVVVAIAQAIARSKARNEMQGSMAASGFTASQQFMSADAKTGIGIDHAGRTVCLTVAGASPRIVRFRDLLEVEILEDDQSVTKTQRTSQAARALVGGLLLGPVGLLAGALTGKKVTEQKVRRIDVKLLVNNPAKPVHLINFLDQQPAIEKTNWQYKNGRQQADHWYGALLACIKQADADDAAAPIPVSAPSQVASSRSVADELEKLADLRARGILTEDEFAEQKSFVLRKS